MEQWGRLRAWALKYRYALAAALLGTALMLLPLGGGREEKPAPKAGVQEEMEAVLSAVEGTGRLRLMLTEGGDGWTGAAVVCEGADSAAVRLELTRAVAALTGLPTDKIAIMKGNP